MSDLPLIRLHSRERYYPKYQIYTRSPNGRSRLCYFEVPPRIPQNPSAPTFLADAASYLRKIKHVLFFFFCSICLIAIENIMLISFQRFYKPLLVYASATKW